MWLRLIELPVHIIFYIEHNINSKFNILRPRWPYGSIRFGAGQVQDFAQQVHEQ